VADAFFAAADWARAGKLPLPAKPADLTMALWIRAAAFPLIAALLIFILSVKHGLHYPCCSFFNTVVGILPGQVCAKIISGACVGVNRVGF